MKIQTQAKLRLLGIDFPVVDFQSTKPLETRSDIEVTIEPKIFFPEDNDTIFKIIHDVEVNVEDTFNLFLVAIGTFEMKNVDEKTRSAFVNINSPAIVFPYIRSFISTLTANLGNVTGTITIPPQQFRGELPEMKESDFKKKINNKNPSGEP